MRPAALLLFGAMALYAQDKTGVVTGSVINSVTGTGIDGATVVLGPITKDPAQAAYHAVTDAAGSFRISGVKPGEYAPMTQKRGFMLPDSATFGRSIHIVAGEDAPPLRLEVIPPARLRGRVIGIDGKPAAKVQVALGGPQYPTTATTNDDGDFIFQDVQPGSYGLMARVKQVRTYFPATTNPALAETIAVTGGADQGRYEIRLQPAPPTYRVRGIVLDAAGKPSPKAVVEILPTSRIDTSGGFLSASAGTISFSIPSRPAGVAPESEDPAVTGSDGVFEFPAVPEGDWIFRAESEDHVFAVADVGLRQDIDDLKIRLETAFDLTGAVTLSDGTPPPEEVAVLVRLNSLDGALGAADLSKKGELHLKNIEPGRFRIHAGGPSGGYYIASVMSGAIDVTHQPVSLNAASPPIRVILKPGSTITGTVEKGDGATVLLVPQTLASGDVGLLRICDSGGKFDFAGLPPGGYYAVAVNRVDLRDLQAVTGVEQLRVLTRDATAVRVDEGAVASVQLKPPIVLP